jgi:large repetitive protein
MPLRTFTITSLSTSPTSPIPQGTRVTLTATVKPAFAPGTVQFQDGTTRLGPPVVVANGTAAGTTSRLLPGEHQLTATFNPSDPGVLTVSAARVVRFVVTGTS